MRDHETAVVSLCDHRARRAGTAPPCAHKAFFFCDDTRGVWCRDCGARMESYDAMRKAVDQLADEVRRRRRESEQDVRRPQE